ncbi:MAG: hypothetical protein IKI29_03195 [Clostridia bacterium]|nr:hypothetical protein [Clostridia bacterium]
MDIAEKVAYLKGLTEGLDLDAESKEGKLFAAIIDVLDEMAIEIEDIETACDDMSDQIDAVDEDLAAVEEILYDEDEEDDDCCDCCDCDDDAVYEIECPECHDIIYLDDEMIEDGSILCPNCKTELEFDFDDCDDDCDCGCGCKDDEEE